MLQHSHGPQNCHPISFLLLMHTSKQGNNLVVHVYMYIQMYKYVHIYVTRLVKICLNVLKKKKNLLKIKDSLYLFAILALPFSFVVTTLQENCLKKPPFIAKREK